MNTQKHIFSDFQSAVRSCTVGLLIILGVFSASPVFAEGGFFEAPNAVRFDERIEAPAFSLPSLTGEEVQLEDYRGKVILLNFWATWCPYCSIERPKLQALHEKYKDDGFIVLGVSIDRAEPDVIKKFVDEKKVTYPILHDRTRQVVGEYSVRGTPTTYLLDVEGKVIGKVIGPAEWDSQATYDLIEQLLKENN